MIDKLPKWIEFKDGEDRKLLHLKITYLPLLVGGNKELQREIQRLEQIYKFRFNRL